MSPPLPGWNRVESVTGIVYLNIKHFGKIETNQFRFNSISGGLLWCSRQAGGGGGMTPPSYKGCGENALERSKLINFRLTLNRAGSRGDQNKRGGTTPSPLLHCLKGIKLNL